MFPKLDLLSYCIPTEVILDSYICFWKLKMEPIAGKDPSDLDGVVSLTFVACVCLACTVTFDA